MRLACLILLSVALAGCAGNTEPGPGALPFANQGLAGNDAADTATPTRPATSTATNSPTPSPTTTPSPTATPTATPTPFVRPAAPLPPSVALCGKALPAGFEAGHTSSFKVEYRMLPDRSYRVFLPEVPLPGAMPVVMLFHELNGDAAGVEAESGFVDVARENGFLLVVPEGSGLPKGWFASNRVPFVVDDVEFASTVLDQVAEDFCIDEQRVYAAGMSNGAFMASMLGCKLSDRVAAIVPVAGVSFPKTTCGGAVPVLAIHGTDDGTVPFESGRMFRLFSYDGARAGVSGWAGHNGCRVQQEPQVEREGWSLERYGDCSSGAETALVVVEGGGHSWPEGSAEFAWEFFSEHRRGSSPASP